MKLTISAAYRAVFYSVTALVVFYLLYVAANFALLTQTSSLLDYEAYARNTLVTAVEFEEPEAAQKALKPLLSGGSVVWRGEPMDVVPLKQFVAPRTVNTAALTKALAAGDTDQYDKQQAQLVNAVAQTVERKRRILVIMQPAVAVLSVLFYVLVIFQVIRRSEATDARDEQVKEEANSILSTVTEGLFLMRADFEIGIEQSASLKEMFRSEKDLQGNFFDFISQYITPNNLQIAKDYIGLLFGERVKEKLVRDLNPLNQVEINIIRRDGSFESRFLNFSFKRVLNRGSLSHLLCSVTDVTREVLLEQQLQQAQEEQEAQIDLLMSVLHIPSNQLAGFFKQADSMLSHINEQLENHCSIQRSASSYDKVLRKGMMEMATVAHRLKGDAAALGLNKFEFLTHDFEEEIAKVRESREAVDGKDLLPVVAKLRALFNELDQMKTLVSRFAELSRETVEDKPLEVDTSDLFSSEAESASSPTDEVLEEANAELIEESEPELDAAEPEVEPEEPSLEEEPASYATEDKLRNLAKTVAERQDKSVALNLALEGLSNAPDDLAVAIESILIQLVRNSVVHGIEPIEQRQSADKAEMGQIKIDVQQADDMLTVVVADDGAGVSADKVLTRAKATGLVPEHIDSLTKKQVMALLFKPGFSNTEEADLDSGRGVGLDAVAKLVKQHGGKLALNFVEGQQCRFKILFPLAKA